MLEGLARLAAWLQPRAWIGGLGVAAALVALPIGVFVISGATGQSLALAAIALLLWSLTLTAFLRAFAGPLPRPDPRAGLLSRLRTRLARLYRWVLAGLIAGLLVLVIWFTLRAGLLIADAQAAAPQQTGQAQESGNTR